VNIKCGVNISDAFDGHVVAIATIASYIFGPNLGPGIPQRRQSKFDHSRSSWRRASPPAK
jgi:hypothetical protein